MYNPTKPGYGAQNQTSFTPNYELTVSNNPYANSPGTTPLTGESA
jgi:hypothetical protein